ncbi:hypothetical protein GCM10011344_33960 [Dokdonia pacifica]|uniref:Uncharacterized protein n=1 Tax=Dokdonia pacifica TaxID=1627892 RepID=A0A239BCE8_9FLAO|nr:hypothetical protein [Dokdonia pacifica]GGG30234.1 hypothetical protein GCM10011344_33960 [Dokdonia pacifica]SNS05282.1 hypothetical protein SAMN06265376_10658 [Dokdonia pacifica]
MIYVSPLIIVFVLIIISNVFYTHKKNKITDTFLKTLETRYKYQFKIIGKVTFSSLHILNDIDLKVFHNEKDILISGYDYYRGRSTKFLFHNSNVLQSIKENNIPNYVITDIQIIEKDKIIIKSDHAEITLLYKSYGKEKYELRDKNFITVLNNLKNIF